MSGLKKLLSLIIVICLITPAVVTYWCGSWYLLDLFVFPEDTLRGAWITTLVSFTTIFFVVLLRDYSRDHYKSCIRNYKARTVLTSLLFYPLALIIVVAWRGVWMLLDHYTTTGLLSGLVTHFVGFFVVMVTKTTSSIVSPPGYCITERYHDPTECTLQIKVCFTKSKSFSPPEMVLRLLNCFVTVCVIGFAVVSYWRGTWVTMDALTMGQTNSKLESAILSICMGLGILITCFCASETINGSNLQPPFPLLWQALEQVFVYVLGFGTVNVWRGLWYMEDIFLQPGFQPTYYALYNHLFGVGLLYCLRGVVNLIGSPAGCRTHGNDVLEGFDMGTYLQPTPKPSKSCDDGKVTALVKEACRKATKTEMENPDTGQPQ